MTKLILVGAVAALLAGCIETLPTSAPIARGPAASTTIAPANWGFLQPYIGRQYLNDGGDWIRIAAAQNGGTLSITVNTLSGSSRPETGVLQVHPTDRPDTYRVILENSGVFSDDEATVVFDPSGRMKVVSGSLNDMQLTLTDDAAHFSYRVQTPATRMQPKPMRRDVYTLPDGSTVPVSLDPDSPYQQLRQTGPFGIWERSVGRTFVGHTLLLKVEKDEAGHLVLSFGNVNPGKEVYAAPSQTNPQGLRAVALPNLPPGSFTTKYLALSADDRLEHRYEGTENLFDNGDHYSVYINRGETILTGGRTRNPDDDSAWTWGSVWRPVTPERLAAAAENLKKREIEQARNRAYAERSRAQRAANSQATANAVMRGLSSGFAQAQETNSRLAQQSDEFERDLNQKLRQIERQHEQRAKDLAGRAGQIMAANAAAATSTNKAAAAPNLASPQASTPGGSDEARRKQAEREQAAEQKRLAETRQREEQKRKSEEAAKQAKAAQQKALQDHLEAERRGIRLRAETCPGGDGFPSVMGTRPNVQPKVASCLIVRFEARCPSDRPGSGMTGAIGQFLGSNSCFDNSSPLPRKLMCEVRQAVVEVTEVTTCQ